MAGSGQTVLAQLRDAVLLRGAGMAGIGNDIDERRLIILLRNGRVVHALGQQAALLHGLQRQAHGQTDTLARDGTLQKNGLPVQRVLSGNDDIGKVLCLRIVAALISHARDLGKDLFPDVRDQ